MIYVVKIIIIIRNNGKRLLNAQTQKRGRFPQEGYEIKSYPSRGKRPLFAFGQFRTQILATNEWERAKSECPERKHSYLLDNGNRTQKWDEKRGHFR